MVKEMKHYIRTPCALHKLSFFRMQTRSSFIMLKDAPTVTSVDELATNRAPVVTRLSAFESKLDSLASMIAKISDSCLLYI